MYTRDMENTVMTNQSLQLQSNGDESTEPQLPLS
jgi:hypothetical protein